ncbi:MAG: ABC transporter permease [Acidimicrobiaceae bacterium]|nr:MAG: ABC transporter permease [Acidimicrobiaceae bacterium]
MERLLQIIFNGLSQGSVYSLIALGLVVVYRGTGHLNFAQGEMALTGAYLTWQFDQWGIPLLIAALLAMVCGFALGAATEFFLVRPLGKKSPFAVFVATIALFLGLNSLDGAIWGGEAKPYPNFFPNDDDDFIRILGAEWRYERLGVFVVMLVLTGLFFLLFKKTKLGLAMRAVASNSESAKLVGIPTNLVLMTSWGLAAAVGALGGSLIASVNTNVNQLTMIVVFIAASAAATLGGFDSPGGAVLSGLFIGVLETGAADYFPDWIGQDLKILPAFVVIMAVLLFRPAGLWGSSRVERV